jgi:hypothetical protein
MNNSDKCFTVKLETPIERTFSFRYISSSAVHTSRLTCLGVLIDEDTRGQCIKLHQLNFITIIN